MPSNEPSVSTPPGGEVLLYEAPDGQVRVDVRLERETIWLSLTQMAELFGRDKSVISRHLRTVFASGELEREAVVAKNATTAADGKTYQVEFFNLDAILSVGYRVNSKRVRGQVLQSRIIPAVPPNPQRAPPLTHFYWPAFCWRRR